MAESGFEYDWQDIQTLLRLIELAETARSHVVNESSALHTILRMKALAKRMAERYMEPSG